MTPAELRAKVQAVIDGIELGEDSVGAVLKPIVPYIVVAKVIEDQIPGLVELVDNWIQGNPPTEAEAQDMLAKLAVLDNPDLP